MKEKDFKILSYYFSRITKYSKNRCHEEDEPIMRNLLKYAKQVYDEFMVMNVKGISWTKFILYGFANAMEGKARVNGEGPFEFTNKNLQKLYDAMNCETLEVDDEGKIYEVSTHPNIKEALMLSEETFGKIKFKALIEKDPYATSEKEYSIESNDDDDEENHKQMFICNWYYFMGKLGDVNCRREWNKICSNEGKQGFRKFYEINEEKTGLENLKQLFKEMNWY